MSEQSVCHSLVAAFQTEVIKRALATTAGNRTRAARLLGLQRTYLLRLMRDRSIDVPRSQPKGRRRDVAPNVPSAPPEFCIKITGWAPATPPNGDDGHPAIATARHRPTTERGRPARSARQATRPPVSRSGLLPPSGDGTIRRRVRLLALIRFPTQEVMIR